MSKGGATLLDDVDLSVADGELVAIIGPSGSGKTTLLRAVAGLDPVQAGEVRIDGVDVTQADTNDRNIAMVFQANVLYSFRDVAGNVGFPLEMQHRPAAEIATRVQAEGRALHLERLMERNPLELSAGHQQLVQIARALVRAPSLFLMDEPLARLDALLRIQMRSELRLVQRGYGVTTLYVTNDPVEAMAMADRLGVLAAGRLVQISSPQEVYGRPASRLVAELTGDLTMLDVAVRSDQTGYWLEHESFRTRVWSEALEPYVGVGVVLGMRPEHLAPANGGFGAVIERVVYHGPFVVTECRVGRDVVAVRTEGAMGRPGESVALAITGGHVFDPVDGRSVMSWS